MAGLTDAGLEIPSVDDIIEEIELDEKGEISATLNVAADSVLGQINTIVATKIHEAWEQLEAVYQGTFPDTATGTTLSYLAAITGTTRKRATKATVTCTLSLNAGTTVPADSAVSVSTDTTMRFVSTESVTNSGGSAADFEVLFEAVEAGSAIFANAGTITAIQDPVSGWTAVSNTLDADRGTDLETDAELRLRREQELAFAGSCTLDAIRADVLAVDGVDTCTVFENTTGFTDADNVPPYSIEVLVYGTPLPSTLPAVEQALLDQILASKPAGVNTHGAESGTATDTAGNDHTISYSEPTEVDVYIDLTLTEGVNYVGDTAVKQAIADWGDTQPTGQSIYASDVICVVQELDGVDFIDITQVNVDDQASPVSVDLILTSRQIGVFDTSRIDVTSV